MDTTKTKGLFGRFTKNSRNKNIGDRKDIDNNMTSPAISTTLTSTPKTETPANRAALVDLITVGSRMMVFLLGATHYSSLKKY